MTPNVITILDGATSHPLSGRRAGARVEMAPEVARALGGPAGVTDLAELAARLGRPLALDLEEGAAYLGAAAPDRQARLASLEAPDFTLPDLDGRSHTLSAHRGTKVFLVAWASW